MIRFIALALVFVLFVGGGFTLSQAQSPQVRQIILTKQQVSAGASYVGLGDITSFTEYWGLRAYNSAYATTLGKLVNVCIAADVACGDLSSDINGSLVNTAVGGSLCSVVTCTIKILYGQVGAKDMGQATEANRPVLTFNCVTTRVCMTFSGTKVLTNAAIGSISQIYSISGVAKRTSINTTANCVLCSSGANVDLVFHGSGFAGMIWGSAFVDAAAAESTWHTLQAVGNGASSSLTVDGGTAATGNPGSSALNNTYAIGANLSPPTGNQLIGTIAEVAIKSGDFTSVISSLNANQRAYWGF